MRGEELYFEIFLNGEIYEDERKNEMGKEKKRKDGKKLKEISANPLYAP